jgi:hypothetical protein
MGMFVVTGRHGRYTVEEAELSRGGVGSIHRTDDPGFVYKKYFSPAKAPSPAALDNLVQVGRDVLVVQGKGPGDTPESSVNWPVDVVPGPGSAVRGVLLPTIPPELFNEHGTVRTLDFLVMKRANPPRAKARLALLLRMAEILAFVDSRGLVHGDVNSRNLAWSLQPAPVMYLIDCDGMLPQDPPPRRGVGAPGWMDPRLLDKRIPAHDHRSDWYCLALAMYRGLLLTPGRLDARLPDGSWPAPSQVSTALAPAVADLIRRGLTDPLRAEDRPTPREWADALVAAYVPGGRFDDAAIARLDKATAPPPKPAPKPQPKPTFTRLPPTNWSTQTPQPPPRPTAPVQPAPPPPVLVAPAPPMYRPVRVGGVATRALYGGLGWYVRGLIACLLLSFLAIPYIAIGLFQLRKVPPGTPGLARARVSFGVYGVLACVVFVSLAVSGSQ